MIRWLALQVDHPRWASRSCDDCAKYVYGANGKISMALGADVRTELPMLRAQVHDPNHRRPPCAQCPKCPPDRPKEPATGREIDGAVWLSLLRWYLEGRVVGFPPDTSPVLAEIAAATAGFLARRAAEEEALRRNRKPVPRPAELVLNWIAYL